MVENMLNLRLNGIETQGREGKLPVFDIEMQTDHVVGSKSTGKIEEWGNVYGDEKRVKWFKHPKLSYQRD